MKPAWGYVKSSVYVIWLLVWCFVGTPDSGSGAVSGPFVCSWGPFIPAGLSCPALMKGFVLSLVVSCDVMFSGCPWRPALFWWGRDGQVDLEERRYGRIMGRIVGGETS